MIIPKLFFQDRDPKSGKDFLRPATTKDIAKLAEEVPALELDVRETGE